MRNSQTKITVIKINDKLRNPQKKHLFICLKNNSLLEFVTLNLLIIKSTRGTEVSFSLFCERNKFPKKIICKEKLTI